MTTAQLSAVRGMDCVCYLAKNLARARGFYEGALGMIPSVQGATWVEYELPDGSTFALSKLPGDAWFVSGGAMFAVDDLQAVIDRVRRAGASVHGEAVETASCIMVWCSDVEGNSFALHKRTCA
ncbi:MAG TPA: VOC family protein [Candidatus Acidoferrales bacterium]|nr:VOC family protein [Candidatus Acidoferrales bacterium]